MDELVARAALVAGALGVALAVTLFLRYRARGEARKLDTGQLALGVHYFSSSACGTCRSARRKLEGRLGESGFTEHSWESEPGLFADLGIDAVPATLIVERMGEGVLHPGDPAKLLARL